jgi:polysaccharide biosynthesis protein PslG
MRADPQAIVISGGMAPAGDGPTTYAPHTWLGDLYADRAKPCFDAIGFHPYVDADVGATSTDPGNPWYQMARSTPSIRSIQAANGDSGKRIWATEVGCRLSLGGASEQAERLSDAMALWPHLPLGGGARLVYVLGPE